MRLALIALVLLAAQTVGPLKFEVATIKPNDGSGHTMGGSCRGVDSPNPPTTIGLGRCHFEMSPLSLLIGIAYPSQTPGPHKITGGPAWLESALWDIDAKAEDPATATRAQLIQMVKTLLGDRFKLQFHLQTSEVQGYSLVVAKTGLKIKEVDNSADKKCSNGGRSSQIIIENCPLGQFINYIGGMAGGPVTDNTGLTGNYSFTFQMPPRLSATDDAETGPSIFTAVREQLGLQLDPIKVKQDFIVVDHAEKPTGN